LEGETVGAGIDPNELVADTEPEPAQPAVAADGDHGKILEAGDDRALSGDATEAPEITDLILPPEQGGCTYHHYEARGTEAM
jgi:hypothetical protein